MSDSIILDQTTLQRLASGDIEGEEYAALLLALDEHPHRWRDCALAFLEEQALTRDLKKLALGDARTFLAAEEQSCSVQRSTDQLQNGLTSEVSAVEPAMSKEDLSAELFAEVHPQTVKGARKQQDVVLASSFDGSGVSRLNRWKSIQKLATLVALLLVSFGIGWKGAGVKNRYVDQVSRLPIELLEKQKSESGELVKNLAVHGDTSTALDPSPPSSSAENIGREEVQSVNPWRSALADSERTESSNIGLADSSIKFISEGQPIPLTPTIPSRLRELERRGLIRIETESSLVPVSLENGQSAIVPTQQLRIVPRAYSY